jgi:hypothetical protein
MDEEINASPILAEVWRPFCDMTSEPTGEGQFTTHQSKRKSAYIANKGAPEGKPW